MRRLVGMGQIVPIGDRTARYCAASAPCRRLISAAGRARAPRRRSLPCCRALSIASMMASIAGSATPARLKEPSASRDIRAPAANQFDARRQVPSKSRSSRSARRSRNAACAAGSGRLSMRMDHDCDADLLPACAGRSPQGAPRSATTVRISKLKGCPDRIEQLAVLQREAGLLQQLESRLQQGAIAAGAVRLGGR